LRRNVLGLGHFRDLGAHPLLNIVMLELPTIMDAQILRDFVTDAIRYWEPRRLLYNLVLAAIVLSYFGMYYPATRSVLSIDSVLFLFLLVVLANVAYCAAYLVDIFVSASSYRDQWKKHRWVLFLIGLLFAAIITRVFSLGMFRP
jgi:hypothetical protein